MLFVFIAGFAWSLWSVLFTKSAVKDLAFLVKMFWLLLLGIIVSAIISAILETPAVPNNHRDIIFCLVHLTAIAAGNLLWAATTKYISAVNIAILCALEVPATILAQLTFLTEFGKEAQGELHIIGALIVFIAILTKSLLELYSFQNNDRNDETLK